MIRDANGNKKFESAAEADALIQEWTRRITRGLHECREVFEANRIVFPFFPQYLSTLYNIANVTRRWIADREAYIAELESKLGVV